MSIKAHMCWDNFVTNTYSCLLAISWSHNWLVSGDFCAAQIQTPCRIQSHNTYPALPLTLVIACDVGVSRGTHIRPSWGHGILLAGWWQTYIGPVLAQTGISRGKYMGSTWQLVASPHGPIISNPCVAHNSAPHWPFMELTGFWHLGPRVGPTWKSVEANTWAPRSNLLQVPMGLSSGSPCVDHESALHWPCMGPMGCYLGILWKKWQ